jgi:hypothetical protein
VYGFGEFLLRYSTFEADCPVRVAWAAGCRVAPQFAASDAIARLYVMPSAARRLIRLRKLIKMRAANDATAPPPGKHKWTLARFIQSRKQQVWEHFEIVTDEATAILKEAVPKKKLGQLLVAFVPARHYCTRFRKLSSMCAIVRSSDSSQDNSKTIAKNRSKVCAKAKNESSPPQARNSFIIARSGRPSRASRSSLS